jgi:hypothetical protein
MPAEHVDLSRAIWRKSSRSGGNGGQCVEVALNLPGIAAVRDSKNPDGARLVCTAERWREFLGSVKGEGGRRA